jgi:hypothetical protein
MQFRNLAKKFGVEYMYVALTAGEIAKVNTIRAGLNYRLGGL